mmetsp:Transcript_101397/g.327214  ORF Transcript_101397/g.327214 Transcript_101397/m.327214 type:complete len:213 (-) Transcript_101397:106-744(-)
MIQANKGQVISKFHVTSLNIRYKELNYFIGVFNRMSGISSMLAGFASSAMMLSVPRWENPWMVVAFLIFTGCAFGMNLLVILIATLCCLWGPGKALRGNDSLHLHQAIEILERQQQLAMRFFVMGLFSYFISSIMVTWLFFDNMGALLATAFLAVSLFMLVRQSLVIRRAFITSQPFTTGYIRGNAIRSDAGAENGSYAYAGSTGGYAARQG